MVVHLFLALTVSIKRLLFPTLCWSINTKSIDGTVYYYEMSLMSFMFKNDARSLATRAATDSLSKINTPVNGRPSLFGIVSIRWRLLFPTLCWSINTKSMVLINYEHRFTKRGEEKSSFA
jgi:hypothetical protein